jgi:hypothetical protein
VSDCLLDTIPAVAILSAPGRIITGGVLVKLKSCFDQPDRVCGCTSSDTCSSCCCKVYPPHVLTSFRVEVFVQDPLAIAIDIKIDGASWDDASKIGNFGLRQRLAAFLMEGKETT